MRRSQNNLNHLPQEIILNILSRLPFESVLNCRLVCKSWKNLPLIDDNNTYFADMHLLSHHHPRHHQDYDNNHHYKKFDDSETMSSFVFLGVCNTLYYVEYDENNHQSYRIHNKMTMPLPTDIWSVVGSCNGLICLSVQLKLFVNDPVYICNPITREFVHLPRFVLNDKHKYSYMSHGFGYHPFTNEYKVVRIYYSIGKSPSVGQVEVYTLGSGGCIGWRSKGEINHTFLENRRGVCLTGALHWLSREGNIVAFDLGDEEFRCLPTPPCFYANWYLRSIIWVLDGCLCFVKQTSCCTADIWLFKKNTNTNTAEEQVSRAWSWSREFTINIDDIGLCNQPLTITKSGEIVLMYGKTIVCCDPETPAEPPKKLGHLNYYIHDNQATSHFNSFVSLKALEENAERLCSIALMD